jgi:hypothetical protein
MEQATPISFPNAPLEYNNSPSPNARAKSWPNAVRFEKSVKSRDLIEDKANFVKDEDEFTLTECST